jgi:beta-phosphoglucomutase
MMLMTKNKLFSAVVFDMDGVVIDTRKPIEAFWHTVAGEHNIVISTETMERQIHGCPARQTVYALFPDLSLEEKEALFERCEHFETTMEYIAMAGIKDLFASLKKHHIPVALVTSSLPPKVSNVVKQLRLEGTFDTIVTSDLVEKGKPDPACYRLAAKKLQVKPEDCIVFEDAVSGVRAAAGANMFTIGVGGAYQAPMLIEAGAGEVIMDFKNVRVKPQAGNVVLEISPALSLAIANS